jgi:hypothetical protein
MSLKVHVLNVTGNHLWLTATSYQTLGPQFMVLESGRTLKICNLVGISKWSGVSPSKNSAPFPYGSLLHSLHEVNKPPPCAQNCDALQSLQVQNTEPTHHGLNLLKH